MCARVVVLTWSLLLLLLRHRYAGMLRRRGVHIDYALLLHVILTLEPEQAALVSDALDEKAEVLVADLVRLVLELLDDELRVVLVDVERELDLLVVGPHRTRALALGLVDDLEAEDHLGALVDTRRGRLFLLAALVFEYLKLEAIILHEPRVVDELANIRSLGTFKP